MEATRTYTFDGKTFHKNSSRGGTSYFRCAKFETLKCTARLIVKGQDAALRGTHTCTSETTATVEDKQEHIDNFIAGQAQDLRKYPSAIYQSLLEEVNSKYAGKIMEIPSRKTVYSKIRHARGPTKANLDDILKPPHSQTLDFKCFLWRIWISDIDDKYHRFAILGSNEGLAVLCMESQIFIDATFRVAPHLFSQCLIVMAYDPSTNLYSPCIWALMTSKDEYIYCEVLHAVVVLLKYRWSPRTVVVDFEKALLSSVRYQFPGSRIVGCFFHFRQALQRKMQKLRCDPDKTTLMLNSLNRLLNVEDMQLNHVLASIEHDPRFSGETWARFWHYFKFMWLWRFPPSLWRNRTNDVQNDDARTNNCLEHYNRRLGSKFMNAHPNLFGFISVIREEEHYFSNLARGTRAGAIPYTVRFDSP
jgi:hypothetical protein